MEIGPSQPEFTERYTFETPRFVLREPDPSPIQGQRRTDLESLRPLSLSSATDEESPPGIMLPGPIPYDDPLKQAESNPARQEPVKVQTLEGREEEPFQPMPARDPLTAREPEPFYRIATETTETLGTEVVGHSTGFEGLQGSPGMLDCGGIDLANAHFESVPPEVS